MKNGKQIPKKWPLKATLGDEMDIITAAETEEEANQIVSSMVTSYMAQNKDLETPKQARKVVLSNIGYCAGYYSPEEGARIHRIYHASHPFFGDFNNHYPTPKEAFEAGVKASETIPNSRPFPNK
jgi:hypothetical protein